MLNPTQMILLGSLRDYRRYKRTPEYRRLVAALHAGLLTFYEFDVRVHRAINYKVLNGELEGVYR